MQAEILAGGDGVKCWNREAIQAYVKKTNEREARLSQQNPDLVIIPGQIKCYGCEAQEYDYGTKCTAHFTKTVFGIVGEIQPRKEDAVGWQREIPGLLTIRPSDG